MLSQLELQSLSTRVDFSPLSGKRVLVTGGSGMLGGYVISAIVQGLQILALPPAKIFSISKSGDFRNLDSLTNSTALILIKGAVEQYNWDEDFEIIIHAASPASPKLYGNFDDLLSSNVIPVEQLISKGKCLETFIFISSGTINGIELKLDELNRNPATVSNLSDLEKYSYAKLLAEKAVLLNTNANDVNGISIRLYPTFGPGIRKNESRATTDFLWKAAQGDVPVLKSDGKSLRTFLYLEDACAAIIKSITSPIGVKQFDLSGEYALSIREFACLISEIGGMSGKISIENSDNVHAHFNNFALPNLKPLADIGMLPKVKLEDGILRTIEWIRKLK